MHVFLLLFRSYFLFCLYLLLLGLYIDEWDDCFMFYGLFLGSVYTGIDGWINGWVY